ncbi:MarR family winged helix-turn-helix transcriptional regulator [Nocardioides sp. DS6]|uniref:MarR family winged helix-turn-helix transcriptional regulator n=1 Tax=Nocardioides eburneus TaxID=3231482 RepID=A0ABV3SZN3_9ACTN
MATDAQYQRLLAFRNALRQFDQWSRDAAKRHGLTHAQHQLMLAIRGSTTPQGPTVGEIADALLVRHHTATELIDRTEELGMVARTRDKEDSRRVHLALTEHGHETLAALTAVHVEELRRLAPIFETLPRPRADD